MKAGGRRRSLASGCAMRAFPPRIAARSPGASIRPPSWPRLRAGPGRPGRAARDLARSLGGADAQGGRAAVRQRVRGVGGRPLHLRAARRRVWRRGAGAGAARDPRDRRRRTPAQRVLVVSHKATIRLLLSSLLGFDARGYRDRLDQAPACLNVLDFKDAVRARLMLFNDTSHYAIGPACRPRACPSGGMPRRSRTTGHEGWQVRPPPPSPLRRRSSRCSPSSPTELPAGGGFLYEPKWDGFRAIVFRGGSDVFIQSRDLRPLDRYFPELHEVLLAGLPDGCVVDGEIVIATPHGLDFDALQLRLHPAASRVAKLAKETPASFVAFDALAIGGRDLRGVPSSERRLLLEQALADVKPPDPPDADDARPRRRDGVALALRGRRPRRRDRQAGAGASTSRASAP